MTQMIELVDKDVKISIMKYSMCSRKERKAWEMEDIQKTQTELLEGKLQISEMKKNETGLTD